MNNAKCARRPACSPLKNPQCRWLCEITFGLGMAISCFCPPGLTLFICALLLVVLGVSILKGQKSC